MSEDSSQPMDRKAFLGEGIRWLAEQVTSRVERSVAPVVRRAFLRPPGAQVEPLFLAMCTRCDACTAACPYEAISVHYGSGGAQDGTPVLVNLRERPCLLCEDMPCIGACPTEALVPVASVAEVRIGVAVMDTLECVAFRGEGCRVCADVCPETLNAIEVREGLPFVVADRCTGCGICESRCPTQTPAIKVYAQ